MKAVDSKAKEVRVAVTADAPLPPPGGMPFPVLQRSVLQVVMQV